MRKEIRVRRFSHGGLAGWNTHERLEIEAQSLYNRGFELTHLCSCPEAGDAALFAFFVKEAPDDSDRTGDAP